MGYWKNLLKVLPLILITLVTASITILTSTAVVFTIAYTKTVFGNSLLGFIITVILAFFILGCGLYTAIIALDKIGSKFWMDGM